MGPAQFAEDWKGICFPTNLEHGCADVTVALKVVELRVLVQTGVHQTSQLVRGIISREPTRKRALVLRRGSNKVEFNLIPVPVGFDEICEEEKKQKEEKRVQELKK